MGNYDRNTVVVFSLWRNVEGGAPPQEGKTGDNKKGNHAVADAREVERQASGGFVATEIEEEEDGQEADKKLNNMFPTIFCMVQTLTDLNSTPPHLEIMAPVASTAEKKVRTRVRKTGKKPGKESWIHGTKLKFSGSRSPAFKSAKALGVKHVTKFYTDVTNLYLQKYPANMEDDEDLEEDEPDPVDPNAPLPLTTTKEEAEEQSQLFDFVRGRIGQWYRREHGGGVKQTDVNMIRELMDAGLEAGLPKPPKLQPWQFYSKLHYDDRVVERFNEVWKVEVQRAIDLEQKAPAAVKEGESPEFKAELVATLERQYAQALAAWDLGCMEGPSRSKEELGAALNNAGFYLQPIADAIKDKLGLHCTIMIAGPIADRGGAIGARSVNSGTTGGLNPKNWHQDDPAGYREVEKAMIGFATKCYSEEECRERALGVPKEGAERVEEAGIVLSGVAPPAPLLSEGDGATGATVTQSGKGASGTKSGRSGEGTTGAVSSEGTQSAGQVTASPARAAAVPREEPLPVVEHEAWMRKDMRSWPAELRNVHTAFRMGERWGPEWANCVNRYLNFEKASGYSEMGPRIGGDDRPSEVKAWVTKGRKWFEPAVLDRASVGKLGKDGSFADRWWAWSVDPAAGEEVDRMLTLCGPNGYMQVLLALMWWGKAVGGGADEEDELDWSSAVGDVDFALGQMLVSGAVKMREAPKKRARGGKKKVAEDADDEEQEEPEENEEPPAAQSPQSLTVDRCALPRLAQAEATAQGKWEEQGVVFSIVAYTTVFGRNVDLLQTSVDGHRDLVQSWRRDRQRRVHAWWDGAAADVAASMLPVEVEDVVDEVVPRCCNVMVVLRAAPRDVRAVFITGNSEGKLKVCSRRLADESRRAGAGGRHADSVVWAVEDVELPVGLVAGRTVQGSAGRVSEEERKREADGV
ncbi:hypothetical protein C8R43DRAFT_946862 [Mycena crocata]|nr:hypothetical protein C8R43DRAFT_946862 [Mycena crocata]